MKKSAIAALYILAVGISPAFAHLNPDDHGSLASGFSHPLFGMDHILVMVAVGLWAWQIGKQAIWIVPSAFVGAMVLGFALAVVGLHLPLVEPLILTSVLTLGLLVAFAINVPVFLGASVVAGFALFHGYAHGGEIGTAAQIAYAAGFAIATTLLHALGIGIGGALNAISGDKTRMTMNMTRVIGGLTFVAGIGFFAA